jgi:hypothetical protein
MKLVSTGVATAVFVLASAGGAAPSSPPARQVVEVTITSHLDIMFSPARFKRGAVVFRVTNRAPAAHEFNINGVTSPYIGSHRTVSITVDFKRAAMYTATLQDCGYLSMCAGGNPDTGPINIVKVT